MSLTAAAAVSRKYSSNRISNSTRIPRTKTVPLSSTTTTLSSLMVAADKMLANNDDSREDSLEVWSSSRPAFFDIGSGNSYNASTSSSVESLIHDDSGGGGGGGLPCDWFGWDIMDIILFFLGTLGNAFALILMRRRGLRSRSYALSLSVLALFNSLTLLVLAIQASDRLVQKHMKATLEAHIGTIGCKFYRIALPIVQLMSHWVVVFITAERFVALCFPFAAVKIFSGSTSKMILSTLFAAVVLSQIWRPFYDIQESPVMTNDSNETGTIQCWADPFQEFQNLDLFLHQLFLLCLLPAVFIFVMNTTVIVQVYRMGRAIRKAGGYHRGGQTVQRVPTMRTTTNAGAGGGGASNNESQPRRSSKSAQGNVSAATKSSGDDGSGRNRKTTILLLTVSCTFFIYISPLLSLMLYVRILHLFEGELAAVMAFARLCTPMKAAALLTNLSYADNFVIFVLAGEKFRRELHLMILKPLALCCPRFFAKKYRQAHSRLSTRLTALRESSNAKGSSATANTRSAWLNNSSLADNNGGGSATENNRFRHHHRDSEGQTNRKSRTQSETIDAECTSCDDDDDDDDDTNNNNDESSYDNGTAVGMSNEESGANCTNNDNFDGGRNCDNNNKAAADGDDHHLEARSSHFSSSIIEAAPPPSYSESTANTAGAAAVAEHDDNGGGQRLQNSIVVIVDDEEDDDEDSTTSRLLLDTQATI